MTGKLLICNSGKQDIASIVQLLTSEKYQVDISLQPFDALQKLASSSFMVMIISIHSGESNWLDMIPLLNTLHPQLPVIVVTDDGSLETERIARRGRIFYYLMKPIEEKELKAVLRDAWKKNQN
ncbi:MAG: response regulator [Acidobacteria bacterium]|nr:response regulator [Acidobacteriota bacterium]MBI3655754.1 response regulator [Acidobacteriota bacterium]